MERAEFFRLFHGVSDNDLALLESKLKPKSFKKGEFLCVPGQVQKELYFITGGVQMSYFDSGDKTHVIAFTYPPNLCAIPESFSFQAPSRYFLTCLTDTETEFITYEKLQEVLDTSHNLERLFRRMAEAILSGMINRHIELHSMSIEERYKVFCERSAHLLQMVPHKYIASYLGIDATNFSKLYNKVRI